ncbi:MAG: NAD(P)/FAD-dependent oxidoreductase [Acidobacteria bacterium]|nr:NAD(P)/FAD-dependent oxidoreductase [Acidobacteriota bacterium]
MQTRAAEVSQTDVAILGAGPAGLTAAYTLLKRAPGKLRVTVLEADPVYVGGIARTVNYKGFRFDIGGHRFFSKSQEIEELWTELLPEDMLVRPRRSRIYYRGKFFSYPLRPLEAFWKLGAVESFLCLASYVRARLAPVPDPRSFEDWVSNQFGRRLYSIFFKSYTEKVWGMSCKEISADWAAQRIKGLSLSSALRNALLPAKGDAAIKTLIHSFRYPRRGPGMMWEACAARIRERGGEVRLGERVTGCVWDEARCAWLVTTRTADGEERRTQARHVISSIPLRQLARGLTPPLSESALAAADALRYRDFLIVALILKDTRRLPDNWLYIHDAGVRVGRVQNFKAWSPEMVPDDSYCCYGMEYFCFEGDGLWSSADEQLVALATKELALIGLADEGEVLDARVVRQRKAYPVYTDDYAEQVEVLRAELESRFPTLHVAGRNGMHKYNNQDHAMMTGLLCAENILAGARVHDVWRVNQDAEYHEEGRAGSESASGSGLRLTPTRVKSSDLG